MKNTTKLWIGVGLLILLSPLGLILPAKLGAGAAWGEWSGEEIRKLVGYVPAGLGRLGELWNSPLPDYALKGQEQAGLRALSFSYIVSGVLGAGVVVALTLLIGRILTRRGGSDAS